MPQPATRKAVGEAVRDIKHLGKSAAGQAEDIITGDDYDPNAPPPADATPPYEPRVTPNQPQVKNPAPPGAQGVRGGGAGRGSAGGGGGVNLKNRRMMGPQSLATPDYDFKLMARGGPVQRTLKFAEGGSVSYGQDYRKVK